jgi:hypothetical protein
MEKIEWQAMASLVPQLRRLQYAANMLSLPEFCEALGLEKDDYARHKWLEFQALGRLHVFDDSVLERLIKFYEATRVKP